MRISVEGIEGLGPQAGPCGGTGWKTPRERWALTLCINLIALESFYEGFGQTRFLGGLRKQARAGEALALALGRDNVHYALSLGRCAGEAAKDAQLPVEGVAQWWAEALRASFALGAIDGGIADPMAQEVAKKVHKACRAAVRLLHGETTAEAIMSRATGDEAAEFLAELADTVVSDGFRV